MVRIDDKEYDELEEIDDALEDEIEDEDPDAWGDEQRLNEPDDEDL